MLFGVTHDLRHRPRQRVDIDLIVEDSEKDLNAIERRLCVLYISPLLTRSVMCQLQSL